MQFFQTAIKLYGPTLMPDEANSFLAALALIPGFLFGFYDEDKQKCVVFVVDAHPGEPLARGQKRVIINRLSNEQ